MQAISHQTAIALVLAIAVGAAAVFFATVRTRRTAIQGLLALAVLFGLAPFALTQPSDAYVFRLSVMMSASMMGVLALALAWGLMANWLGGQVGWLAPGRRRRLWASTVALGLTLGPAAAATAYIVERQLVPDAACAERAMFRIGARTFTVPREIGAGFTASGDAWRGRYGAYVRSKPDVVALCDRTDDGAKPLAVESLRFSLSAMKRLLPEDCLDAPAPSTACLATSMKTTTSVHLHAEADRVPEEWARYFAAADMGDDVATGGDLAKGHVCGMLGHIYRRCALWLPVGGGVLAVAVIAYQSLTDAERLARADAGVALALRMSKLEKDREADE